MAELMTKADADAQAAAAAAKPEPTAAEAAALDAAAELILSLLEPTIGDSIREQALVFNRIPLAYTIAGLVLRTHEAGESNSPILDPSWPRRFAVADPLQGAIYQCEVCATRFKPTRYKQRTCGKADCGAEIARRDQLTPVVRPRRTLGLRIEARR